MSSTPNRENTLRSIASEERSRVRFMNKTRRKIKIFWIDFNGRPILFSILENGEFIDINTYVTHPWIFLDYITKERYLVNKREVYMPRPTDDDVVEQVGEQPVITKRRDLVYIIQPLYTLRELCVRLIKDRLTHDRQAFSLELPRILQHEIANAEPRKS